jgi:hypothetical protein
MENSLWDNEIRVGRQTKMRTEAKFPHEEKSDQVAPDPERAERDGETNNE